MFLKKSPYLFVFFILLFSSQIFGETFLNKSYLGEKRLDSYSERYQPLVFQNIYRGQLTFVDEIFFGNFLNQYIFENGNELNFYINSELYSAATCSNTDLASHFEDIRYSYRLITFSYLLEGMWHFQEMSRHLRLNSCKFDVGEFLKSCRPKSEEMKKFVKRLGQYNPKYSDKISREVNPDSWWKEYLGRKFIHYSQYKVAQSCGRNCVQSELPRYFQTSCDEHKDLMKKVCSEEDEVWGLATNLEAYHLLSTSNIINTFNKKGEANGCLRRFSELMAHREPQYPVIKLLFPVIYDYLKKTHKERFLQGRVFFYGAAKEYEEKGLADIWVKDQTLVVEKAPELIADEPTPKVAVKVETKKVEAKPQAVVEAPKVVQVKKPEMPANPKSAFLQAAQARSEQNLDRLAVDMLKLKYDYVFTLSMTNALSERLKSFMTQEALKEMASYDKLGSKQGPVPLLFLKFMIDYQEHQGLWNLVSILGTSFYVSNEIDTYYKPKVEKIELLNDASTNRSWQIYIVKED